MSNPWEGKQIWIYVLSVCPPVNQLVAQAKQMGLTGILVKGWDGAHFWPQIQQVIGPAHAAGLNIGAWGYSYGTNPVAEAKAARQCIDAGADWLVIDAEVEYERGEIGAEMAVRTKAAFRGMFGQSLPIGFTSFGLPDQHPNFPWQDFSSWCGCALPQVYWADFGMSAPAAFSASLYQCRRYGLPVLPAGQLYQTRGEWPRPQDIQCFGELAMAAGLDGVSFYAWDKASAEGLSAVKEARFLAPNQPDDWAAEAWEWATKAGITDGTLPRGNCTREEVIEFLYRYEQMKVKEVAAKGDVMAK